jgi:hypothetical protein
MALKTVFSVGPGVFTDEEFARAVGELSKPELDEGWDLLVEAMGTKIYRKYREESGLYEYKTFGEMADLDPEMCAQVYVDWEYRRVWDSYIINLHPIKDRTTGLEGLYWCVDYPWPLSDRDYTFIRDFKIVEVEGVRTYAVMAKSHPFPDEPERSGVVRVDTFQQSCVMQSDGNTGSKAFMHYYDNPKGMIPSWVINWAAKVSHTHTSWVINWAAKVSHTHTSWVINWAAKTGVPHFLELMRKAVFGYPAFLEARREELGLASLDNVERMRRLYGVPAEDIPEIPDRVKQ